MNITEQERQIASTVVARFMNLGEPTQRKALLRKFKNPDAIDQLQKKSFFNSSGPDLYLPLPMAFQHCGDDELLAKARMATETSLWVLQNLDESYPEKPDGVFTFDEFADHASKLYGQKLDGKMLRLGLAMATNFGIFRHWAGVDFSSIGLHENIVTIKPEMAWDDYIRAREAAIEGTARAAVLDELVPVFAQSTYPMPLQPPEAYEYHSEIKRVSEKLLSEANFRQAALDAFIHVISQVKERTGMHQYDGDDLMNRAFAPDGRTPPVKFNALRNETEKNEQRGIFNLFKGIVGLRNFEAHIVTVFVSPHRAHEYLALASLLMRLLDNAIIDTAPQKLQAAPASQGTKNARLRTIEIVAQGTGPDGPTLGSEPSIHQGFTALSCVFTIITYTAQPIKIAPKRVVVGGTELVADLFFQLESRAKVGSIIVRGNIQENYRFYIRISTHGVPKNQRGIVEFEVDGRDDLLPVKIQFPSL